MSYSLSCISPSQFLRASYISQDYVFIERNDYLICHPFTKPQTEALFIVLDVSINDCRPSFFTSLDCNWFGLCNLEVPTLCLLSYLKHLNVCQPLCLIYVSSVDFISPGCSSILNSGELLILSANIFRPWVIWFYLVLNKCFVNLQYAFSRHLPFGGSWL